MTLIDGDRIVNAQLYDDEHEEFVEKKMSIIDFINAYTEEGVTAADDILDEIKAEIEQVKFIMNEEIINNNRKDLINFVNGLNQSLVIVDKYKAESEVRNEQTSR